MDLECIDSEFRVVEVKVDEEMPGFGDSLLLRFKESSPFEVYNHTHRVPKSGKTVVGLLRGEGVKVLDSGRRGLRVKNRQASAVGKIALLESWEENLDEGVMRGSKMISKTTKKRAYMLVVDCKGFYVIVEREYMRSDPKNGTRVLVENIRDLTNNPKNTLKSCYLGSDIC